MTPHQVPANNAQQQMRRESLYHWHMISLYLDIWNENHGRKPKP